MKTYPRVFVRINHISHLVAGMKGFVHGTVYGTESARPATFNESWLLELPGPDEPRRLVLFKSTTELACAHFVTW